MEASRSCMRSLSRHLPRLGAQVWGGRGPEHLVATQSCEVCLGGPDSEANAGPVGLGRMFSSTVGAAQASPEAAPQQPTAPPAGSGAPAAAGPSPGVNQNPLRGPRPNVSGFTAGGRPGQNVSPMQRRVSQQVMALQQKMHALMIEGKFKDAVKLFEDFINEGFKEAQATKLERGQLPLMRRPAEFQWLQYLQALNRSQRMATATISEAIKLMKQVGIQPRAAHYQMLLYCLMRQSNSGRAMAVIDEMIQNGIRPTMPCYENAIFACLYNKDLDGTAMLLDSNFRTPSWRIQDIERGRALYTKVVIFCAQLKKIENALIFMKQMQDLHMRIPVHLYLDIISNATEVDDCVAVYSILCDLEKKQSIVNVDGRSVFIPIKLDEGVLLLVLNAAARVGETVLADKAWEMLQLSLKLPYFHELSAKVEYHAEAADDEVHEEDSALTDQTKIEDSVAAAPQPVQAPDTTNSREVSENWEEILNDKLHRGRYPLIACYHAYIEAQARGGEIEKAFKAVRELEERYPDNEKSLSASQGLSMLADELAKDANTVDQAFYLLDQWHKGGEHKVTTPMLDVVVAACSRMGDANRAFETFEAYDRLGIKQRSDSYNALMEVCAQNRQVEVIMKLVQEMATAGVKPNVDTYMQIIEGYINNADTSGITHALTITRREGFMPTLKVLEQAFACAERYNDVQAKQLIRREMMQAGYRFSLQVRGRYQGGPGRGGYRGRGGGGGGRGGRGGYQNYNQGQNPGAFTPPQSPGGAQPGPGPMGPTSNPPGVVDNPGAGVYNPGGGGGYRGGYRGRGRGRGGGRGGYQNTFGYQSGYQQGGYQGSYQGGYQGENQGNFQGGFDGAYQGSYQGGASPSPSSPPVEQLGQAGAAGAGPTDQPVGASVPGEYSSPVPQDIQITPPPADSGFPAPEPPSEPVQAPPEAQKTE